MPLVPKPIVLVLKLSRSSGSLYQDHPACYVLITSPHFCVNILFGTPGWTTIIWLEVRSILNILLVSRLHWNNCRSAYTSSTRFNPEKFQRLFKRGIFLFESSCPSKQEKDQEIESNCTKQEPNESPWPIRNRCLIYLEGDIEIQSSSAPWSSREWRLKEAKARRIRRAN